MQRAEVVLSILSQKSRENQHFVFSRIYRHLFNKTFYSGQSNTLTELIDETVELLRKETFDPKRMRKSAGMVASAVLAIMDSIYQGYRFEDSRNNSIHPSLSYIPTSLGEFDWIFKGSFKDFTNEKTFSSLLAFLKIRISDTRFIELVQAFLSSEFKSDFLTRIVGAIDGYYKTQFPFYIRVKNEFIIAINGKKSDANQFREWMNNHDILLTNDDFLLQNLKGKHLRFAGYTIYKRKNGKVNLLVDQKEIEQKIKIFMYKGKPIPVGSRLNLKKTDILRLYNIDMREFRESYCLAQNFNLKLRKFRYYHYTSLLKTLATKEKTTVKSILKKYGLEIKTKDGLKTRSVIAMNGCRYSGY